MIFAISEVGCEDHGRAPFIGKSEHDREQPAVWPAAGPTEIKREVITVGIINKSFRLLGGWFALVYPQILQGIYEISAGNRDNGFAGSGALE